MKRVVYGCIVWAALSLAPSPAPATEFVFLQNGRVIQADRVEELGDRVRIVKPTETIELPRSEVVSIHPYSPPSGTSGYPSPADTYRDMTQQMNDKVRREIETKPGTR